MAASNKNKNTKGLRVIETARSLNSINKAAIYGFKPLVKRVEPSDKIRAKYCVMQNKKTGEIEIHSDYRSNSLFREMDDFEKVIDWTYYYPYSFSSPFAAYLIPKDIQVGERVFLEDLIEDYIGTSWNQGDTFRLKSCEAIWNGNDLEIQYNPRIDRTNLMG